MGLTEHGIYSQMSDEDLIALASLDLPVKEDPVDLVIRVRNTLGRKFEVTDITNGGAQGTELYEAAEGWLKSLEDPDSDFLRDLLSRYKRGGGLTDGQAKGVLNCLYFTETRKRSGFAQGVAIGMRQIMAKHDVSVAEKVPMPKAEALQANTEWADVAAEIAAADAYRDHCASSVSKGSYTVVLPDGHRTIKLSDWKDDSYRPGSRVRWISFLSGPHNDADYTTFARQGDDGKLHMLSRFASHSALKGAAEVVLYGSTEERAEMREAYAMASSKCAICGRKLTVPASLHRGIGPDCAERGVF